MMNPIADRGDALPQAHPETCAGQGLGLPAHPHPCAALSPGACGLAGVNRAASFIRFPHAGNSAAWPVLTAVNRSQRMQTELRLMGSATRPKHTHTAAEMAACKTKTHACRIALMHSGLSQETVAQRMSVTSGYLSLLLNGKRRWSDDLQHRYMHITGSLAPLQWDAMREGVELYVDSRRVREAELMAELDELRRAA